MTIKTLVPRLGYLLRASIKITGYRSYIDQLGLDKDLDDLALEVRPSAASELMQRIEDACSKELATDCGTDWAQFFRLAWVRTRESIQTLAQCVDASPLMHEQGQEVFSRQFTVPMLSGLLRLCLSTHQGPDADSWWKSPFLAWTHFSAHKAAIAHQDLLANLANHLDADPRTIERWVAGEPMGKIGWPIRSTVRAALRTQGQGQLGYSEIDLMAGWLLLAVAFQSLPSGLRDAARRDFSLRRQEPWSLDDAVIALQRLAFDHGSTPMRATVVPLLTDIDRLFAVRPRDDIAIQRQLDTFRGLIEQAPLASHGAYQYMHDWYSARLAALKGNQNAALLGYAAAVSGSWWFAGPNQPPILNEALLYAVGVGDKVAAENYWDKTFMLGLNKGPKRPLDEQEMRRIAFAFEKMFFPHKAKARIPPQVELILWDKEFSISSKHLANPNQKVKFAEGRTRRTPLMEAIRDGTLDDVKRLIDAGGDPNDFIKESGEGPLSYAMRRACDRKDPIIMEFLLGLDLLPETVNRPVSTQRETPLKIAIEMAHAQAVTRLIVLGADVEKPCDQVPSALCYAMVALHRSLHPHDKTQERGYLAGKSRADAHDAKDGAVLDVQLAARRQGLHAMTQMTDWGRNVFEAIREFYARPAEDCRQVIQALLRGGADANRRYKVEPHHLDEWTPTLFAAEVGDLSVFKMLVEHPGPNRGDPELTLRSSSSLERFDALWVAIAYGRHAIVTYLMGRANK